MSDLTVVKAIAAVEAALSDLHLVVVKQEHAVQKLQAKTNNRKKLTKGDVARIRAYYGTGHWTFKELGDSFNIHPSTALRIVKGQYWK